ncbi:peptidyl-prolyl cis-trans isomerase FKBP43-like isoform X2 [Macadamia integrifolia]|uniref:peptidyl-prolyl cis-trans isomerase FKBP43-like isoform X2 n=1 Tax=Macadamia integrifolia TaxID=60698 RepID=UPI001C4F8E21|nr:peptidyl-prolyl cis-trans isomerase FKBP43-like isoform X2 [Macadamia integrifolia]
MTFWGIEVKPGKPHTHQYSKDGARLHISQATLSYGGSTWTKRSVVQCNVGKSSPVLLCSLLPDKIETCHLDLEFQEDEEVIFSVLGPQSIYLSGYYLNPGLHRLNRYDDDTDSCGEDIAETESDPCRDSEEDDYDSNDSFINDGDPEEHSPSPQAKTKSIDEHFHLSPQSTPGRKEKCNPRRKRLKKKYQVSDSDEEKDASQRQTTMKESADLNLDSEEEDTCVISSLFKRKKIVKNEKVVKESITKTAEDGKQEQSEDDGSRAMCSKRKIQTVIGERKLDQPSNPSVPSVDDDNEVNETPKEKKRKKKEIVGQEKNLDYSMCMDHDQPTGNSKSDIYKGNGHCKELEIKNMDNELTIRDELNREFLIDDMDSEKPKKKKEKVNERKHTSTEEDDHEDLESKEPYLQIKELDRINSSVQEFNANLEDQTGKLKKKKKKKGDKNEHMTSEDDGSKPLQLKEPSLDNLKINPIVSDVQEFSAHPRDENEKLKKHKKKKSAKKKTTTTGDDVSEPLQSKGPCLESVGHDQQVHNDQKSNADLQNEKIHGLYVGKVDDEIEIRIKRKKKGKSKSYENDTTPRPGASNDN